MSEKLWGASFPIWFAVDQHGAPDLRAFHDPEKAKWFVRMFPEMRLIEAECKILLDKNFKRKRRAKRSA